MIVVDPGHTYLLDHLDGDNQSILAFVKREGEGFPGNVGHHEGTNMQEVLRALIDRVQYLDDQISSPHNYQVLWHLRACIQNLEQRAAERHGLPASAAYNLWKDTFVEDLPTCHHCGHIVCERMNVS